MSIAPANSASIAEGPALKLVHCTLTCGPIALSNQPLALPIMAWACVMLGNAPTRIVLAAPWAHPETTNANQRENPTSILLFTLVASDDHGQNAGLIFLLALRTLTVLAGLRAVVGDQVGQSGVVEDARGRIANVEKHLVESAVGKIAIDQFA